MTFDANQFMEQAAAPMATRPDLVPEGEWIAYIGSEPDSVGIETFNRKDGKGVVTRATLLWEISDEALKINMKRDKIIARDQFLLDVIDKGGGQFALEEGGDKNNRLGSRRAALGMNDASWTWNRFRGAGPARIKVVHEADEKDPTVKYARVSRVAPMAA